jgi:hypothetical protein
LLLSIALFALDTPPVIVAFATPPIVPETFPV